MKEQRPYEPKLEDVFKLSGIPTYTFVKPMEYDRLLIALRTPGRGVVVEGPSGIGKTTAISQALKELGIDHEILSARKKADVVRITELSQKIDKGVFIIDDFHRLGENIKQDIADHLKVLADEERIDTKLIIVGINKVGDSLVSLASDLNNRIDTIHFEANTIDLVSLLVRKGEEALNIEIEVKDKIVQSANGSFYIVQMLCHRACLRNKVTNRQVKKCSVNISYESICEDIMKDLERRFKEIAIKFATGPSLRREGRAPYLHILRWLAEGNEWSISLRHKMAIHPEQKGSVGQVVEKNYLKKFLDSDPQFAQILHFDPKTRVITVEDPQFVFYLRNLNWNRFAGEVGYLGIHFDSRYDFALSFAGPDRAIAKRLFELLRQNEFEVFYDANEQSNILGEDIEEYLRPIYRSEASYVLCLLGPEYPKRVWTRFESSQFKARFSQGKVIPIWFTTAEPGTFDESTRVGGMTIDPNNFKKQLPILVKHLKQKIEEDSLKRGVSS
jgi:hypothetical protein